MSRIAPVSRDQRRFDPVADVINAHYDLKLGYPSSHQFALDSASPGARVLDLGAGPGGFARELVRKGCTVTVVDRAFDDPAAIRTSPASYATPDDGSARAGA